MERKKKRERRDSEKHWERRHKDTKRELGKRDGTYQKKRVDHNCFYSKDISS